MGKLIVLEGTDGSGKSTQFKMLCQALEGERVPFHTLVFPRYGEESSALIRMYLGGEFGKEPEAVNAYAASSFYAVDRYAAWKQDWEETYRRGGLILADRYTTSNAVHQACKVPEGEREDFFGWLSDYEYAKLGLPAPDMVIWLDMPTEKAIENLRNREKATHTTADIHEVDTEYLKKCRQAAKDAAEFYGWQRVKCLDERGELRSMEDIHGEIMGLVKGLLG